MRLKCDCGFRTFSRRRMRRHRRKCEVLNSGRQTESRNPERPEIEKEQKTIAELREEAKQEGITGIYTKNKAELIEALKG